MCQVSFTEEQSCEMRLAYPCGGTPVMDPTGGVCSCRFMGAPDTFNFLFDSTDADLISECVVGLCKFWYLLRAQPCLFRLESGLMQCAESCS